ncbi:excalibur calcium-binding domain-containing protein [Actinoplanes sp. NPDC023801]|uniref:excalibur calcium-binding domain-containing protein n=1 Tax=Actinoplanes sp. NPDC023801 TaxID=3154595 RepID=UPI0033E1617F
MGTLGLCAVMFLAPDREAGPATAPDRSTAAAVRQAATVASAASPTGSATAGRKPDTTPAASKPVKPSPPTAKPTATKVPSKSPAAVHYADCDAAPGELTRGGPGYRAALDRDGDGIACEANGDDDAPVETEEPTTGTDPRFDTCAKANAAGYGPYVRGTDPEYEWYQDRDSDGVVCER